MEKKEYLAGFGKRLQERREYLRLTQQELSDKLGIAKSMISAYEHGTTDPRLTIIRPLSIALGVSASWLTDDEEALPLGKDKEKAEKIVLYAKFLDHTEKEN